MTRDGYRAGMPITVRRALVVLAVVLLLVFTIVSVGTATTSHPFAWLGAGLVCLAASLFP